MAQVLVCLPQQKVETLPWLGQDGERVRAKPVKTEGIMGQHALAKQRSAPLLIAGIKTEVSEETNPAYSLILINRGLWISGQDASIPARCKPGTAASCLHSWHITSSRSSSAA